MEKGLIKEMANSDLPRKKKGKSMEKGLIKEMANSDLPWEKEKKRKSVEKG